MPRADYNGHSRSRNTDDRHSGVGVRSLCTIYLSVHLSGYHSKGKEQGNECIMRNWKKVRFCDKEPTRPGIVIKINDAS